MSAPLFYFFYMKFSYSVFSKLVREKRLEMRLNQEDFAKQTGVSFRTLQNIEAGRHKTDLDTVRRILNKVGYTLSIEKK